MGCSAEKDLAGALDDISAEAVREFDRLHLVIAEEAAAEFRARDDLKGLIGRNSIDVVAANLTTHARFAAAMFHLKSVPTIVKSLRWMYHSYPARGFSDGYYQAESEAWRNAIERHLAPEHAASVGGFYRTIAAHRDQLKSQAGELLPPADVPKTMRGLYDEYLAALLKPEMGAAIRVSAGYIDSRMDRIAPFWEDVIRPAMYLVGTMWSEGVITVGQEHMASSIAERTLSAFYTMVLKTPHSAERLVVSVTPGELHEIGARMAADLLELRGFDVRYTGADTPRDSIITLLASCKAEWLLLSTTMAANLGPVPGLISAVREANLPQRPRVLVGGQAYLLDEDMWRKVGADGEAHSAEEVHAFIGSEGAGIR